MHQTEVPKPLKVDPWTTSSLLQKAIRRGETELARRAGLTLYRHRGVGVFRRLCTISVEDIGIADIGLLQDVVRIGTDKSLRSMLGADVELIADLCTRMAKAPKDRSADFLYCASTKLEAAISEREALQTLPATELIAIAKDPLVPLIKRAIAAQLLCEADQSKLRPDAVERLLDAFSVKPLPLHNAVIDLARSGGHPFCLTLPLIWSRWWHAGAEASISTQSLPPTEFLNGVPLYALDKHTAVGKQAIARFAKVNGQVAKSLGRWVPEARWSDVAGIAVFYAESERVDRRLVWSAGSLLARAGFLADMTEAGCHVDGVDEVLRCVRDNLTHLNGLRRAAFGGNFTRSR